MYEVRSEVMIENELLALETQFRHDGFSFLTLC